MRRNNKVRVVLGVVLMVSAVVMGLIFVFNTQYPATVFLAIVFFVGAVTIVKRD